MTEVTYRIPCISRHVATQPHVSLVLSWDGEVRAVALREGLPLVVGRSEPAHVVVPHRSLSRTHARFSLRAGAVYVEDLGSTNGTLVNGQPPTGRPLSEGDEVSLGSIEVRVTGSFASPTELHTTLSLHAWLRRLDEELVRARAFGREVSVLALQHGTSVLDRAAIVLPTPVDFASAYAPGLTLLCLPEVKSSEAQKRVVTAQTEPGVKVIGVAGFPGDGASAERLLSCALAGGELGAAEAAFEAGANPAAPVVINPAMRRLYDMVTRVARTTLPVLVLGETGSGKELIAREVHARSLRAQGPFKAVNCAAIPAGLVEAVLFGHERGAFTGADKRKAGIFEEANGGSVFLDEVGELSPHAQAALLRVLETKQIARVGSSQEVAVDVRVIAATHRDLSGMAAAGTFREDLMFRLDALSLSVPPLRERRDEVQALAELFLERSRSQWNVNARGLSEDALEALRQFNWPGNVRQLRNVIERAATLCAGERIELEDLPEELWLSTADTERPPQPTDVVEVKNLTERMRGLEKTWIREALQEARGNHARAARLLGIPRGTLVYKLRLHGLLEAE